MMLSRLGSPGYVSLVITLLLASLMSCLLVINHLFQLYYQHVQSSVAYTQAYASSLSGLRLYPLYSDHVTSFLLGVPTRDDFELLPFFTYQNISFKLLKTPLYIYAYGTYEGNHCILKHAYR